MNYTGLGQSFTGALHSAGEREAQDKKQRKAANKQKAIAKSAGVTKRPHKPKQKGIRIRKGAVVKVCSLSARLHQLQEGITLLTIDAPQHVRASWRCVS